MSTAAATVAAPQNGGTRPLSAEDRRTLRLEVDRRRRALVADDPVPRTYDVVELLADGFEQLARRRPTTLRSAALIVGVDPVAARRAARMLARRGDIKLVRRERCRSGRGIRGFYLWTGI